jgi:hypothetical protein
MKSRHFVKSERKRKGDGNGVGGGEGDRNAVVERLVIPDVATIVSAHVDLRSDDGREPAERDPRDAATGGAPVLRLGGDQAQEYVAPLRCDENRNAETTTTKTTTTTTMTTTTTTRTTTTTTTTTTMTTTTTTKTTSTTRSGHAAMTRTLDFRIVRGGKKFVPLNPNALVDDASCGGSHAARISTGFANVTGPGGVRRREGRTEVFFTVLH